MALREPSIKVEAITVVAGNCALPICLKNALFTVEQAGTYCPPVFAGLTAPFMRPLFTAEAEHGKDGMGNMNLPEPHLKCEQGHAVDAIIETAHEFAGELEVITLGPLSNLALALLKEPGIAKEIKSVTIMGGCGLGPGNITPLAEFNIYVDAEAAFVVIDSGLNKTVVGWDVCCSETFINPDDIDHLNALGSLGRFAVRCNASLREFNLRWGKDGFDLPDPTTVAAALYPDMITHQFRAYGMVDYKSENAYGQFMIDKDHLLGKDANVNVVTEIDAQQFKQKLFQLLA
jgi:purine nucleosidase